MEMGTDSLNGSERNCLYENDLAGAAEPDFASAAYARGADLLQDGRAVVVFDMDRDGDQDVFVSNYRRRGSLLRNDATGRNWLEVKLVGTRSNRDAVGARVVVRAGDLVQTREVRIGEAFLSQGSLVQHFGLGAAERVDSIEIRWPSGLEERLGPAEPNRLLRITEGGHGLAAAR